MAGEECSLCLIVKEIFSKHMFPLTPLPPTCREAWLVCLADKLCAAGETCGGLREKLSVLRLKHA